MVTTRDERTRATFTVTCRHCTRVIIENVPLLDDAGTRTLRVHLAACYGNDSPSAGLGDVLFHFSVRDCPTAQTEFRDKSD